MRTYRMTIEYQPQDWMADRVRCCVVVQADNLIAATYKVPACLPHGACDISAVRNVDRW